MADKPDIPKCYKCVHRDEVPGDAHSMCRHPEAGSENSMGSLMATFASVRRVEPVVNLSGADALNIKANPHGARMGWFNWPYNFDPIWLEGCDGFEAKAKSEAAE